MQWFIVGGVPVLFFASPLYLPLQSIKMYTIDDCKKSLSK